MYMLNLHARGGGAHVETGVAVQVVARHVVRLNLLGQPPGVVVAGTPLSFSFEVLNLGNTASRITPLVELDPEWDYELSAAELDLPSGGAEIFEATITPPAEMAKAINLRLKLLLVTPETSRDDPADQVRASTQVVPAGTGAADASLAASLAGALRLQADYSEDGEFVLQPQYSAAGNLGPGRSGAVELVLPSLTSDTEGTFSGEERLTVTYTDEGWGSVQLGDVTASLGSSLTGSSASGRGASLRFDSASSQWLVFYTEPRSSWGETSYGVQYTQQVGGGLSLIVGAQDRQRSESELTAGSTDLGRRFLSAKASYQPSESWDLQAELAASDGDDTGSDTAYRYRGRFRFDFISGGAEYVQAGRNYLGGWRDTEFYQLDLAWRPSPRFKLWGDYTTRRRNIDDIPTEEGIASERVKLGTSWNSAAGTTVSVRYSELSENDEVLGLTDEETSYYEYKLSQRWDNFRISASWRDEVEDDFITGRRLEREELDVGTTLELGDSLDLSLDYNREDEDDGAGAASREQYSVGSKIRVGEDGRASIDYRISDSDTGGEESWLSGRYSQQFNGGQNLDFELQYNSRGNGDELSMALTYTLPVSLPISFIKVRGRISGRVLSADGSGAGIPGVLLVLDNKHMVVSDEDGAFSFPPVEPGVHYVAVDQNSLAAGRSPEAAQVTCRRDGAEVPEAERIAVVRERLEELAAARREAAQEETGPDGEPVESGLPEEPLLPEAGRWPLALLVNAGEEWELSIPVRAGAILSGYVWLAGAADTAAMPDAVVELQNGGETYYRLTDPAGRFLFTGLPPGEYTVRLVESRLPEYHSVEPVQHTVSLAAGERAEGLEFTVSPEEREIEITEF
jgi:hypothetical protein